MRKQRDVLRRAVFGNGEIFFGEADDRLAVGTAIRGIIQRFMIQRASYTRISAFCVPRSGTARCSRFC